MKGKSVLIVDDEKNIRLTLSQALEALEVETDTAANGEEALAKLQEGEFGLILLDLKMPGMDGMEVLREVSKIRPDIRIIILTAYGTVESAVEAMKLGAADFIRKPFAAEEIRELVSRVIDREKLDEQKTVDYASSIELAKRRIGDRHFDAAVERVRKAISLDPGRPEAFNLLGALMEIRGDRIEAQKNYRAALSLDPSYEPAIKNLQRSTLQMENAGGMLLEEAKKEKKQSLPASQDLLTGSALFFLSCCGIVKGAIEISRRFDPGGSHRGRSLADVSPPFRTLPVIRSFG
jgi:DNA-binding response OmpR family regulator